MFTFVMQKKDTELRGSEPDPEVRQVWSADFESKISEASRV